MLTQKRVSSFKVWFKKKRERRSLGNLRRRTKNTREREREKEEEEEDLLASSF